MELIKLSHDYLYNQYKLFIYIYISFFYEVMNIFIVGTNFSSYAYIEILWSKYIAYMLLFVRSVSIKWFLI